MEYIGPDMGITLFTAVPGKRSYHSINTSTFTLFCSVYTREHFQMYDNISSLSAHVEVGGRGIMFLGS